MLSHLIRKEFLDSLLNQRFMALAVFSIILMPLSAVINYQYFEVRRASFDSQFAEYTKENENAGAYRAYRPPGLLSTLARGTEPFMPIYFGFHNAGTSTSGTDRIQPGNIEAQDFSTLSTFGSFDLLFLVQVVFSLLAVLLAFDMIAGEKERGTLKALLANSIGRDKIIVGKFIGGYAVLWITFFTGFLLLYLVFAVLDSRFLELDTAAKILFILGLSSLCLACFFSLGLMVSTFCYTSRTAIIALLILWVVMQLVIPKTGEILATIIFPVRSEHALRVEREQTIEQIQNEAAEKGGDLYLQLSGQPDLRDLFQHMRSGESWVENFKRRYQDISREANPRLESKLREINQQWEREKERQRRLSRSLALLSPASALTFLVTDASGTGDLAYQRYRESVYDQYRIVDREVYSRQRSNRFYIRHNGSAWMGSFGGNDETAPANIPPFTVSYSSWRDVITANVWSLATLFFYLIVPFLVGYTRFLSYDVR